MAISSIDNNKIYNGLSSNPLESNPGDDNQNVQESSSDKFVAQPLEILNEQNIVDKSGKTGYSEEVNAAKGKRDKVLFVGIILFILSVLVLVFKIVGNIF